MVRPVGSMKGKADLYSDINSEVEIDVRTGEVSARPTVFRYSDSGVVAYKPHWCCVWITGLQNHRISVYKSELLYLIKALQTLEDE